jgi:hypothetical protein
VGYSGVGSTFKAIYLKGLWVMVESLRGAKSGTPLPPKSMVLQGFVEIQHPGYQNRYQKKPSRRMAFYLALIVCYLNWSSTLKHFSGIKGAA